MFERNLPGFGMMATKARAAQEAQQEERKAKRGKYSNFKCCLLHLFSKTVFIKIQLRIAVARIFRGA